MYRSNVSGFVLGDVATFVPGMLTMTKPLVAVTATQPTKTTPVVSAPTREQPTVEQLLDGSVSLPKFGVPNPGPARYLYGPGVAQLQRWLGAPVSSMWDAASWAALMAFVQSQAMAGEAAETTLARLAIEAGLDPSVEKNKRAALMRKLKAVAEQPAAPAAAPAAAPQAQMQVAPEADNSKLMLAAAGAAVLGFLWWKKGR